MNRTARIRTLAAALAAAALLTLTACEGDTPSTSDDNAPAATQEAPAADEESTEGDSGTGVLPDMVGGDLQAAQDGAQAAGFWNLDDQDATDQGRLQVFDRNWIVCSQDPEPGTYTLDTPVTFYAVKDTESC